MYESIVVGTDGSETAGIALAEAMRLAEAGQGTLHIVSAYEPLRGARIKGAPDGAAKVWDVKPDTLVEGLVEEAASQARMRGITVHTHTLTGDAGDALLAIADEQRASLIVVGNRGMHGVGRMLGSVPNRVSHRANCHVLIVATQN